MTEPTKKPPPTDEGVVDEVKVHEGQSLPSRSEQHKSQNIYDTATFFENYSKLLRSRNGLDGAPEWPRLRQMLEAVHIGGKRVLDLGCGYGWFCRWAVEQGADYVLGVDLSEKMLDRAREMTPAECKEITYMRQDLETFTVPDEQRGQYALVFSSLTLHYVADLVRLLKQVRFATEGGDYFVFSVEHPIFTAGSRHGMITNEDGSRVWSLDGYQLEGERVTNWLADGVKKQHRTLSTYFTLLREAGFDVVDLEEWHPSPEELQAHPEWSDEMIRPMFLLICARRR